MGGHRANGPAPAQEGLAPMQHPSSQSVRRVRHERGIYYRDTPAGRRYEIVYTDSDGRQRSGRRRRDQAGARRARRQAR